MPESPVRGLYLGMNARPWQPFDGASVNQQHPLNTFFDDEFGRRFRYGLNGAVALVSGALVQSAILAGATTTLQSVAAVNTAAPIGTTRIMTTIITTAQAANLFAEGWVGVWDADISAVYTRRIKGNGPLTTTGAADLTSYIDLYDPLPVALTTSDKLALMTNPFQSITVVPATTPTGITLGGVNCAVPIANYCWVQTRGWFAAQVVVGALIVGPTQPGGTAGAVIPNTGALFFQSAGNSPATWAAATAGVIWLNCE